MVYVRKHIRKTRDGSTIVRAYYRNGINYYHGTTLNRWNVIKQEGLKIDKSPDKTIYLTSEFSDAKDWAKGTPRLSLNDRPAILKVNVPYSAKQDWAFRDNTRKVKQVMVFENIKPNRIHLTKKI